MPVGNKSTKDFKHTQTTHSHPNNSPQSNAISPRLSNRAAIALQKLQLDLQSICIEKDKCLLVNTAAVNELSQIPILIKHTEHNLIKKYIPWKIYDSNPRSLYHHQLPNESDGHFLRVETLIYNNQSRKSVIFYESSNTLLQKAHHLPTTPSAYPLTSIYKLVEVT